MSILAIDPGYERSAWVLFDVAPIAHGLDRNSDLLGEIRMMRTAPAAFGAIVGTVVIEQIESFGMAVGREVFETVFWSGRFVQAAYPTPFVQLPRRAVKLHLCQDSRAKDPNIRAALIDRFGGSAAIGRKANPGPLYGISGDVWSALAVAVTFADTPGAWT